MKTLGTAEEDVDDLAAWIARSRKSEEAARAAERAKAAKLAAALAAQVGMPFEKKKKISLIRTSTGLCKVPLNEEASKARKQ